MKITKLSLIFQKYVIKLSDLNPMRKKVRPRITSIIQSKQLYSLNLKKTFIFIILFVDSFSRAFRVGRSQFI